MWRLTRNNTITESFHTKMEVIRRQAWPFCNFQDCMLRVEVLCGQTGLGSGPSPVLAESRGFGWCAGSVV
jgi:hypothetical protein